MAENKVLGAEIVGNMLVIRAPITRTVSKSGKTIIIANSGGFQPLCKSTDGEMIKVNVCATVPNPDAPTVAK